MITEEVRNLAHKSAGAAKSTTELIADTQTRAEAGVQVAAEVATVLGEVTMANEKVEALVRGGSATAMEQAQAVKVVNTAIAEVQQATEINAASAEETSAASEELFSQAGILDGSLGILAAIIGVEGRHATNGAGRLQVGYHKPRLLTQSREGHGAFLWPRFCFWPRACSWPRALMPCGKKPRSAITQPSQAPPVVPAYISYRPHAFQKNSGVGPTSFPMAKT